MELLPHAKYQDNRHRLRALLWPRVFSPRACSASTVQQRFAGLHQNLKSSLRCFPQQTLRTRTTRAGGTPSQATSNHGSETPLFRDRPRNWVCIHAQPQRASQSSVQWTQSSVQWTHLPSGPAAGTTPPLLLPSHWQPQPVPHHSSPATAPSLEGATCLILSGSKESCRQRWNVSTGELGGASRVETPLHVQWL